MSESASLVPDMNAIPLSRARVLGPRVSDLIAALQMLDPDARHGVAEVRVCRKFVFGGGEIRTAEFIGENGDVFGTEDFSDDPEEV